MKVRSIRDVPLIQKDKCIASVLMPTRGRPEKLKRAIQSLYDTAENPDKIELFLRVDDDDYATLAMASWFQQTYNRLQIKVLIGPRGRGYLDLHHHIHAMARESIGTWLVNFNDDAIMQTQGWDASLDTTLFASDGVENVGDKGFLWMDDIWLITPFAIQRQETAEFFMVKRKVYQVLGHLSLNMGVDLWLEKVMNLVERRVRIEINIDHTNEEDATFREGRGSVKGEVLKELTATWDVKMSRLTDAHTLMSYLEHRQRSGVGKVAAEVVREGLILDYQGNRWLLKEDEVG